tara:strand:+ start:318 stop:953 length:636 start_codon:yes stop_codon:yes gene_type:complete
MNNLFFGGSSNIAKKISKKLKYTDSISTKKIQNCYKKTFRVKNYQKKTIDNLLKNINVKYDNILIFNGIYSLSLLSFFSKKEFLKSIQINLVTPLEIASSIISSKILKKNGSIFFISSVASNENLIGNAYYSISKNSINFASKILGNEQEKRGIRVNAILLGLINNTMGKKVKKLTNSKKSYIKDKKLINDFKKILSNKTLNKKSIKIYND